MKKIFYILLLLPLLVTAQSQDQNYIKTLTYKLPSTTSDATKAQVNVTYLDGLGRPIQQVAGKMSNTGKDIITHIEYDGYNRQTKNYLPFPSQNSNLEFVQSAAIPTVQYYTDQYADGNAFSEKLLENSPLSRVLKQGAPGNTWQINAMNDTDHSIKFSYQTNIVSEVKKLRAAANTTSFTISCVSDGTHAAGQLYKTVTKNENWVRGTANTTEEFKNKEGQLILKRAYIGTDKHDTYYVYDQFGNLTYVLPPAVSGDAIYLDDLCYQYKYDSRNRLVEKKLPGKQWEFIVYDALDRVIATGPTLTPFGGKTETAADQGWMRTYYDAFGRIAYTGWYSTSVTSATRATLQAANTGAVTNVVRGTGTIDNLATNYTLLSTLPIGFKLLSLNYYDDYLWLASTERPTSSTQVEGVAVSVNVKGLSTGGWVRILETASDVNGEVSYTYYDTKGRTLRTKSTNYLGGYLITDSNFDFDGTPQYTVSKFRRLGSDIAELMTRDNYTYTEQDRLLTHTHKINSATPQLLSYNDYDSLGQLKSKALGGTGAIGSTLQQIDYKYNIRGWITDINNVNNLTETGAMADLFAFKIDYNTPGDDLNGIIAPLYNGNISETQWRSSNDNILRKYSYKYDNLNRLTDAYYQKPGQADPETGSYNESVTYDKHGNIRSLHRTGGLDDPITVIDTDILQYNYPTGSNQIQSIVDNSGSPQGFFDGGNGTVDYTYDANGNMRTDINKGISSITYNHLNQPVEIVFNNSATKKINYLYNAAGVKVRKIVVEGSNFVTTEYLDGFQYKNATLQYFPTAEGYVDVTPSSLIGGSPTYNYVYQYKDHLGNVRMNFAMGVTRKGFPPIINIKDESHYYPFGLKHLNYNVNYLEYQDIEGDIVLYPSISTTGKLPYNYKYQGQERQDELGLNWDSFKYRNYDYAIGRFMSIDPLAQDYSYNSPYAFQENKLGMGRELEGLEMELHPWLTANAASNPNGVGAHVQGIKNGLTNVAKGLVNAVSNPRKTAMGIANTVVGGMSNNSAAAMQIDHALGTNSLGAKEAFSSAVDNAVNNLINGNGNQRGEVIGEIIGSLVVGEGIGAVSSNITRIGKGAATLETGVTSDFLVTEQGVAIPQAGGKYNISSDLVTNPHNPPGTTSFGTIEGGKFNESLRIDPATPAGKKGPNYSHYHKDGKGKHYSPNGKDKDPGF